MKSLFRVCLFFTVIGSVIAWASTSQAQLKKLYDPQKVVTIQGHIAKLETITRQGRQANNNRKTLIAQVKTAQGLKVVHLGPAEFLAQQQFFPKTGDKVEVTGGRIETRQGEVILAARVTSGGKAFQLRDERGVPVWSGQTPGCYGSDNRRSRS